MIAISIVIPCYNEQDVLPETITRLDILFKKLKVQNKINSQSQIFLVDDGSTDETWYQIETHAQKKDYIHGIKLSRNQGHQNALLAGLLSAKGDAVISIDADLQDDLNAVEKMIDKFTSGKDIVYGVRKKRKTDSFFKRFTAEGYYRLLKKMGVDVVFNHADYRLMSRRAIEALRQFREINLFLRAIIPLIGFSSAIVYYDRNERFAGNSKYPLKKMIALAWQGITSFSAVPLKIITVTGALVFLGSLSITFWAIGIRIFTEKAIPGWASTVVPIYLIGGIQLLGIGIIGEYLAKVYMETKARPLFIIEKKL